MLLTNEAPMSEESLLRGHRILENLLEQFLGILQDARRRAVNLDRGELHARCLQALAEAARGGTSVLLLAREPGELALELSSGPLPCAPERMHMRLSAEERTRVCADPPALGAQPSMRILAGELLGTSEVFACGLVHHEQVQGALVLIPATAPLTDRERDLLRHVTTEIGVLLQTADAFAGLVDTSMLDELTGLFNHRYLGRRLRQELSRASRHGHPLSLLFCDIDDFRAYNHTFGQMAGDHLLRDLAGFFHPGTRRPDVTFSFRASDVPVRYGGEEFVVLLPETPAAGARTKAERLCRAVAATPFTGAHSQPLGNVSVSVGVATFPEDASDAVAILDAARTALDRAKQGGKNQVQTA